MQKIFQGEEGAKSLQFPHSPLADSSTIIFHFHTTILALNMKSFCGQLSGLYGSFFGAKDSLLINFCLFQGEFIHDFVFGTCQVRIQHITKFWNQHQNNMNAQSRKAVSK